ncbi:MAG: helix-turn-helix transcriptional regulator [Gemmatimonadaceae bacterium]|nr:helix-turn-helix transcriptional regulator [Gemmatimonadaceae bacterium]
MAESFTSDRRRMRPEDRRREVLDAARRVFLDAGFRGASLNAVSEEAGVTKGCLYHYFDSKEELLLALLRDRAQEADALGDAVQDAQSRDDVLAKAVHLLWERYEREGELDMTGMVLTELPHAPAVAQTFFDEVIVKKREALRQAFETQGPGTVDPELAAMLIPSMIMGVALGYRLCRGLDGSKYSSKQIEEAMLTILSRGV